MWNDERARRNNGTCRRIGYNASDGDASRRIWNEARENAARGKTLEGCWSDCAADDVTIGWPDHTVKKRYGDQSNSMSFTRNDVTRD